MRKSRTVPIATLAAAAIAFSACGDDEDETAYCVDEDNVVVENDECDERYRSTSHGGFFWLFLGSNRLGGRRPAPGQRLPTDGAERVRANDRSTLQSKGGFGSSARSGGVGRTVSGGG
jgi:hypothetical protein